ncbi:hypothetical protein [Aidingimonas lacisalsi]|uniref:hypothetical protein n=1 Tax=Aidingimonas lacisalsi TaxID=2604086 RepID=UPI0011D1B081|nr:hypothetical protein [Aidingimonas lacisalsi]
MSIKRVSVLILSLLCACSAFADLPADADNDSNHVHDFAAAIETVPDTESAAAEYCQLPSVGDELLMAQGCCRVCTTGKACGDSCINRSYTCHQPPGCACNG